MKRSGDEKRKQKELIRAMLSLAPVMQQGTLVRNYRRCGNPNCRCARGQKHGPHYYLSTRRGGKTKMDYTPKILMNQVKKELGNYRKFKQLLSELLELNYQTFLKERRELKERKKDVR